MNDTKLLVNYALKVDWLNYEDWDYSNGFSFDVDQQGLYIATIDSGDSYIQKYGIIEVGKRYRISFDLSGWVNGSSLGGIRVAVGNSYITNAIIGNGTKTYITTAASSDLFRINALANTSGLSIKNLRIEEIGYQELDLFEDSQIALNYQFKEIADPSANLGSYSKDITIPGSKFNNKFFSQIFEINQDNTFNMGAKCNAVIQVDEDVLMNGFIKLDSIISLDNMINYNIVFYGQSVNLFSDIGDSTFDDLDFSDLNHSFGESRPYFSWSDFENDIVDYVYPYISYGDDDWVLQGKLGRGIDTSGVGLSNLDFYPAIRIKYIYDKIFEKWGYTYNSSVLESDYFKKAILPYGQAADKIKNWTQLARIQPQYAYQYHVATSNGIDTTTGKFITGYFVYAAQGSGILGSYWSELPAPPAYRFKLVQAYDPYDLFNTFYNGYTNNPWTQTVSSQWILPGTYGIQTTGKYKIKYKFQVKKNASSIGNFKMWAFRFNEGDFSWHSSYPHSDWTVASSTSEQTELLLDVDMSSVGTTAWIEGEAEFDCEPGDMIGLKHTNVYANPISDLVYLEYLEIEKIDWGQLTPVDFDLVKPGETKVKDFLTSLNNMFNFVWVPDIEDPYNINIEPAQYYFDNSGTTRNWSSKLDLSKDIKIELPKDYLYQYYNFKYQDADDYMNDYWNLNQDQVGLGFGAKKIKTDNDFLSNELTISPIFKPSPMATPSVNNKAYSYTIYRKKDYSSERDTNVGHRILYFNMVEPQGGYKFRYQTQALTEYGIAMHVLNPNTQTTAGAYDLNYDFDLEVNGVYQPMGIYRPPANGVTITQNNLYNLYWRQLIEDYVNKDSRLVTAYFNLKANDLVDFQFADDILVDNTYYRVHKIHDFDPTGQNLTKVELLKLSAPTISFNTAVTTTDTTINIIPIVEKPSFAISLGRNNNLDVTSKGIIIGDNSTLREGDQSLIIGDNSSGGKLIIGDGNRGQDGSVILGSGNTISDGINATIIGNDKRVTTDGVYIGDMKIVNGVILTEGGVVDGGVIETDGVYNQYKRKDYMINDCGENGNQLNDINVFKIKDGGTI